MSRSPRKRFRPTVGNQSAFSLVELLVSIAVIALLVTLLLPVLTSIRTHANRTKCVIHLKSWGQAIAAYAAENEGQIQFHNWPSVGSSSQFYEKYLSDGKLRTHALKVTTATEYFRLCPSAEWNGEGNAPVRYSMIRPHPHVSSAGSYRLTSAVNPSRLILMTDSSGTPSVIDSVEKFVAATAPLIHEPAQARHARNINVLYADGHVETHGAELFEPDAEGNSPLEALLRLHPEA